VYQLKRSRSYRCYHSQGSYYSTQKTAIKLWVKHNGNPSTQVPVKGCKNLDDFADKVKQKLNTNCQVALFTSLDKEALRLGLNITEQLKTDLKTKSDAIPLFVKLLPTTQDPIVTKTNFIGKKDLSSSEQYPKMTMT